jgi:hypothetical protein
LRRARQSVSRAAIFALLARKLQSIRSWQHAARSFTSNKTRSRSTHYRRRASTILGKRSRHNEKPLAFNAAICCCLVRMGQRPEGGIAMRFEMKQRVHRTVTNAFGAEIRSRTRLGAGWHTCMCRPPMKAPRGGAGYCSKKCEQQNRNERRRDQRATDRARRPRKPGKCAVCGAKLVGQVRSTCANAATPAASRRTGAGADKSNAPCYSAAAVRPASSTPACHRQPKSRRAVPTEACAHKSGIAFANGAFPHQPDRINRG